MAWQRPVRYLVALAGLGFAGSLYFFIDKHHTHIAAPTGINPAKDVTFQGNAGTTVRAKNDKPVGTTKFATIKEYADGTTRLEKPVIDFAHGDRRFHITSEICEYKNAPGADVGALPDVTTFKGSVVLKSDDGLELRTDEATYSEIDGLATVPGRMSFSRGRLTGTSMGATYQHKEDVMTMLDQAEIRMAADPTGQGVLHGTAKTIVMARSDHNLRFDDHAVIVRDNQTIRANNAMVYLTPDDNTVRAMELRGASSLMPPPNKADAPPELHSENINLDFGSDGRTVRHTKLEGGRSKIITKSDNAARTIDADAIEATLAPDGQRLTGLDARGGTVQVDIAATATTAPRKITAQSLVAKGTDTGGLTDANFDGGVTSVSTPLQKDPAKKPGEQTTRASTMTFELNGDLGSVTRIRFHEKFSFKSPEVTATADQASYVEASGKLTMAPSTDRSHDFPSVSVSRMSLSAPQSIDVDTNTNDLHAVGTADVPVTGTLKPEVDQDPKKQAAPPGLFDDKKPIIAKGTEWRYTHSTGAAEFIGSARLSQDPDQLTADTIVANDSGDLLASGTVHSIVTFDDSNKPSSSAAAAALQRKCRPASTTCVDAHDLKYDDDKRVATYLGTGSGKGDAVFDDPSGQVISGDAIVLTLASSGRSVDKAVTDGANNGMKALLEGTRYVTGNELIYTAGDDAYRATGSELNVVTRTVDSGGGEICQQFTGRRMLFLPQNDTLHRTDDKLQVFEDLLTGRQSQGKQMAACPPQLLVKK